MWATDVYATITFISISFKQIIPTIITLIRIRENKYFIILWEFNVVINRIMPYLPIFNMRDAKIIDP